MSAQPVVTAAPMPRVTIHVGDCRDVLKTLPAESVDCCVTSPPYFGLRDYSTGTWEGGDPACEHRVRTPGAVAKSQASSTLTSTSRDVVGHTKEGFRAVCARCGARRIDRQIGLEADVAAYVQALVDVFAEVWRVLKPQGSLWLNLGDSYAGSGRGPTGKHGVGRHEQRQGFDSPGAARYGLKAKDLMLIPWRVAIALQDAGWYVRSVVAWTKRNPMPESVTDRPTNAWEPVLLLTKRARYFYDAEAVRQPVAQSTVGRGPVDFGGAKGRDYKSTIAPDDPNFRNGSEQWGRTFDYTRSSANGANLRNVWDLATEPFSADDLGVDVDHYATFPPEVPRRAISAGSSERGVCSKCGKPWTRCIERVADGNRREVDRGFPGNPQAPGGASWQPAIYRPSGWQPSCKCNAPTRPAIVLDPFGGAGTTGLVASQLGREAILVELNPRYARLAEARIRADCPLFANVEVR